MRIRIDAVEPVIKPIFRENKISGSSSPVAKIEMNTAIVPTINPATTEIEMASLFEMSVTLFVGGNRSRVRGWGYIDLRRIVGNCVCIVCQQEGLIGGLVDDSPIVLVAGSVVVTVCALKGGSMVKDTLKDGSDDESMPNSLKNGRMERDREIKISSVLGVVSGLLLLMFFVSPLMLEEGTVPELSGRANTIDYMNEDSWGNDEHAENGKLGHNQSAHGGYFSWSELNPVFGFVYAFGDINCHQKHDRSWSLNDNQMPVCTRDIGIFSGFFMGCLFFRLRGLNRWTVRDSFLSVFDDGSIESVYFTDRRMRLMVLLLMLGIVPMAIDGFTQLLTEYESTNGVRVITGFMAGFVIGWFVCSALSSKPDLFESPSSVVLPANSRLSLVDHPDA